MANKRPPLSSFFKQISPIQKEDLEPETSTEAFIRKLRGPKGDSPSVAELEALIKPLIPEPIAGKDGKTPTAKELLPIISSLIPEVKDGKTPSIEELEAIILPLIPDPIQPEFTPDTGKEIIEKVNKSRGSKIKASKVEGFEDLKNDAEGTKRTMQRYLSLGGQRQTIIQSNGTTIATGATTLNFTNGTLSIPLGNDGSTVNYAAPSSGGGGALVGSQEKSTTSPNNATQTFAFAHTPTVIFWNGAFQTLTDDYTVSGNNITFTASAGVPQVGDKIVNLYA